MIKNMKQLIPFLGLCLLTLGTSKAVLLGQSTGSGYAYFGGADFVAQIGEIDADFIVFTPYETIIEIEYIDFTSASGSFVVDDSASNWAALESLFTDGTRQYLQSGRVGFTEASLFGGTTLNGHDAAGYDITSVEFALGLVIESNSEFMHRQVSLRVFGEPVNTPEQGATALLFGCGLVGLFGVRHFSSTSLRSS